MSSVSSVGAPIIPDQVLEDNICYLCDRYLTVSPISAHPNGGNVCGRCHQKVSKSSSCLFECNSFLDLIEQINIPYAIFSYANHLFPCVNRYEGCTKLLTFDEISTHEKHCSSKKCKCGLCSYEGTGSQQLNHFRTKHSQNFFNRIYFRFPLDVKYSINLVKTGKTLFFVHFKIDHEENKVLFYVKPTTASLDDDVDFFCLLKDADDGEVIDQTTLTKRKSDGIYHTLHIKGKQYLDDSSNLFCECLLKRVSRKYMKMYPTRSRTSIV